MDTEGLRQISMTEQIVGDDMFAVNDKLQFVLASMIGKTIYQASLDYFGPDTDKLLTIYRFDDDIKICDPTRVKVYVDYSNKPHK